MDESIGKWLAAAALAMTGALVAGCPATQAVGTQPSGALVEVPLQAEAADKVDLLFMIDNSASMGDKQAILADAVPKLLVSLLKPRCADPVTGIAVSSGATADPQGSKADRFGCPAGTEPEFKPVTAMHIGVISSSLGAFGGDVCADSGRQNDLAHLLASDVSAPAEDVAEYDRDTPGFLTIGLVCVAPAWTGLGDVYVRTRDVERDA